MRIARKFILFLSALVLAIVVTAPRALKPPRAPTSAASNTTSAARPVVVLAARIVYVRCARQPATKTTISVFTSADPWRYEIGRDKANPVIQGAIAEYENVDLPQEVDDEASKS